MSDRSYITRRRLLELLGVTSISSLAGCGGQRVTSEPLESIELPWTKLPGPPGGPVIYISISESEPEWIYTTTRTAGVFATNDGGANWIQGFSSQHHRRRIWASPKDPQTAFTHRELTINGGKKWHAPQWFNLERYAPSSAPATDHDDSDTARVYNLEWDPFDEQTIYAARPDGFYVTVDGAQSWNRRPIGDVTFPPFHQGWDFAIHPNIEGLIVAGVGNVVAVSKDRGNTWSLKNLSGEYPMTRDRYIRGVEFEGRNSRNVYLAIEELGVFRYAENSLSEVSSNISNLVFPPWDASPSVSANGVKMYFVAGTSQETYPVQRWWDSRQLYQLERGASQLSTVDTPTKPNTITCHPTEASTLFIGGNSWVHKSTDGGATWEALSNSFVDHYLSVIAVNQSRPETVFPGSICSTGLSVSRDRGQSYEWKRSGLYPWHTQHDFSEHYLMQISARGESVYATTAAGLLISEDSGETWLLMENRFSGEGELGEPHTHLHGLAIHPDNSDIIYVGTGRGGFGGENQDTFSGARVWKSTDGGESWVERTAGFPTNIDTTVQDIVVNPLDPEIVYVATNAEDYIGPGKTGGEGAGLWVSFDGGQSWEKLETRFSNIHAISVDAGDANTLYVSSAHPEPQETRGVYRSSDNGNSWDEVLDVGTYALLAHPTEPGILFVGAQKYQHYWDILVSKNGGDDWSEGNLRIQSGTDSEGQIMDYDAKELHSDYRGNSSGQPMQFAIDEVNSLLYLATNGVGLWQAEIDDI